MDKAVVKDHIKEFESIFMKNEKNIRKSQDGRTQCKCPVEVESLLHVRVREMAPCGFVFNAGACKTEAGKTTLAECLGAHSFGICSGCDSSGIERFFSPCMRLTTHSHRKIVMTPVSDLAAFMLSEGMSRDNAFHDSMLKDYFTKLTLEHATKYLKSAKVA